MQIGSVERASTAFEDILIEKSTPLEFALTSFKMQFNKYWPLLLLGGFGFLIRIPWIDIGLPQQYHPDEWAYFTTAFKFIKMNFVNTGVQIPNLFMYLLFAGYIVTIPVLFLKGDVHSFKEYYASFYAFGDPYLDYANPAFLVTARLVSVVMTVACGILIGMYVQKRYSRTIALETAAVFYLLPTEFQYSRFGVPDNCLMTAIFIGIILILRFIDKPVLLRWIAACSTVVIAASIKVPGAILIIPLVWGLWKIRGSSDRTALIRFGALAILIFLIGGALLAPNMLFSSVGTSHVAVIIDILRSTHGADPEGFRHDSHSTVWQYFYFIYFDYGPVLLGICLIGLYGLCKKPMKETLVWLMVIVPFFVVFQCASAKMSRYIIPVTSLFFILAFPAGLERVGAGKIVKKWFAYVGLLIVLLAYPVYRIALFYSVWSKEDTRLQARNWLVKHDYSTRNFAREIHETPLVPAHYKKPLIENWNCGRYSIGELRKKGIEMLMISSSYTSFARESHIYKNYQSYFDSLPLIAKFKSDDDNHGLIACNPAIFIFQVPQTDRGRD